MLCNPLLLFCRRLLLRLELPLRLLLQQHLLVV
jgi:hypothetical protein